MKIVPVVDENGVHYRVKHYRYSDSLSGISLEEFTVIKETPCGYWVAPDWCYHDHELEDQFKKWVSKTSRKRYAYPTMQEAWHSYKIRKRRHIHMLERQLRMAKMRSNAAENVIGDKPPDQNHFISLHHDTGTLIK